MAFTQEINVTKDSIKDFEVVLFAPDPLDPEGESAGTISVQIGLSNGKVMVREYDLLARLNDDATGQAHLANLVFMRDYIRSRLESEVLPP